MTKCKIPVARKCSECDTIITKRRTAFTCSTKCSSARVYRIEGEIEGAAVGRVSAKCTECDTIFDRTLRGRGASVTCSTKCSNSRVWLREAERAEKILKIRADKRAAGKESVSKDSYPKNITLYLPNGLECFPSAMAFELGATLEKPVKKSKKSKAKGQKWQWDIDD